MLNWRDKIPAVFVRRVNLAGVVFVLTILLVGLAAVVSANNLLFLILGALMATLLVSGFVSRLSLAGLELDVILPEHIAARQRLAARVVVRNLKRRMPSFSVHVAGSTREVISSVLYFPVIPGGAALSALADVCFSRRGLHSEDSFELSTSFPFGFLERRARVRLRRDVLVYPCIDPQAGFEILLSSVSGDIEAYYRGRGHDFYRIRPYEALESSRHVDWKATAHTGELQVREFAREEDPLVEIYFDLEIPEDARDWFEHAVDCCAYLAWSLSRKSARIHFRTQDFQIMIPAEGDVYTVLKYLALVKPLPGRPVHGPIQRSSFPIVFSAVPRRLAEAGWGQAYTIAPDTLPAEGRPGG